MGESPPEVNKPTSCCRNFQTNSAPPHPHAEVRHFCLSLVDACAWLNSNTIRHFNARERTRTHVACFGSGLPQYLRPQAQYHTHIAHRTPHIGSRTCVFAYYSERRARDDGVDGGRFAHASDVEQQTTVRHTAPEPTPRI